MFSAMAKVFQGLAPSFRTYALGMNLQQEIKDRLIVYWSKIQGVLYQLQFVRVQLQPFS
jgi:hypothetical protein